MEAIPFENFEPLCKDSVFLSPRASHAHLFFYRPTISVMVCFVFVLLLLLPSRVQLDSPFAGTFPYLTGLDLDIHTISRCESYLPN
jgi:hypothetical protein